MSIKATYGGTTANNVTALPFKNKNGVTVGTVQLSEVGTIPTPTATKDITSNGNGIPVSEYAYVNVNVPTGGATPQYQEKTVTSNGTVTPDSGYDALSRVIVNVPTTGETDSNVYEFDIVLSEDYTSTTQSNIGDLPTDAKNALIQKMTDILGSPMSNSDGELFVKEEVTYSGSGAGMLKSTGAILFYKNTSGRIQNQGNQAAFGNGTYISTSHSFFPSVFCTDVGGYNPTISCRCNASTWLTYYAGTYHFKISF